MIFCSYYLDTPTSASVAARSCPSMFDVVWTGGRLPPAPLRFGRRVEHERFREIPKVAEILIGIRGTSRPRPENRLRSGRGGICGV